MPPPSPVRPQHHFPLYHVDDTGEMLSFFWWVTLPLVGNVTLALYHAATCYPWIQGELSPIFLLPCPNFKILGFEDLGVANRFPAKTGSAGLPKLGLWIIDKIKN